MMEEKMPQTDEKQQTERKKNKAKIFIVCLLICSCWLLGYIAVSPLVIVLGHNYCYVASQGELWMFFCFLLLMPLLHVLFIVIKQKIPSRTKYYKIMALLVFLFYLNVWLARAMHIYIACDIEPTINTVKFGIETGRFSFEPAPAMGG